MQWRGQADFYALMRQHGVFVHAPDGYLYAGGANKECGGYEVCAFTLIVGSLDSF